MLVLFINLKKMHLNNFKKQHKTNYIQHTIVLNTLSDIASIKSSLRLDVWNTNE